MSNSFNSVFPNQMLPLREKLKLHEGEPVPLWVKQNANYFSQELLYYTSEKYEMHQLYKVAEGKLVDSDYNYITNPFNTTNEKYSKYPAKLRNYDIIEPILDHFLGDKRSTPHGMVVICTNEDSLNKFKIELSQGYMNLLSQDFVNNLNAQGFETGVPSKEIPDYEAFGDNFSENWNDTRSIVGQEAYNYLIRNLKLNEQYVAQFYDWLVVGRVCSYKDVCHDDVERRIIHPTKLTIIGMDDTSPYYEDATAQICQYRWNASSIINKFRENLSKDQIEIIHKLEHDAIQRYNTHYVNEEFIHSNEGIYATVNDGLIPIEHIVWKSLELRKILTYVDPMTGQEAEMLVDEDYEFEPEKGDLAIEEIWEQHWWECWRIHENFHSKDQDPHGHIYLKWGIGEVQRTELNNTSVCKLPYNGRDWGYRRNSIRSIVKALIPYQQLYNVFHYRFELSLAKSKDKLMLFPLQAIPRTKGWDMDRWMYSIHAFSIAFFDAADKDVKAAMQAMKEIDMSLANYMQQFWTFMLQIKEEAWDRVGMNRQRYGETKASDLKGVNQQAINQASVLTKNLFDTFNDYEEAEANGLLDYSKYAWIEGKKGIYIDSSSRRRFFEVNGIEHTETSYGVFAKRSSDERARVEMLKQSIQAFAQNGTKPSDIAAILDSDNVSEIRALLEKGEALQREFEERQSKAQQEHEQKLAQLEAQEKEAERELEKYKIDENNKTDIEEALIISDSYNAGTDKDADGIDDSQEIVQRYEDRRLEREKLEEQRRSNKRKEELEDRKIKSQERMAKLNKDKQDKK